MYARMYKYVFFPAVMFPQPSSGVLEFLFRSAFLGSALLILSVLGDPLVTPWRPMDAETAPGRHLVSHFRKVCGILATK